MQGAEDYRPKGPCSWGSPSSGYPGFGRTTQTGALRRAVVHEWAILRALVQEVALNAKPPVVHSDPEILGGTPVFVGTRVPFQALLDYLEAGDPLDEFLTDFPSVTREQAVTALEQAKEALLANACPPR